MSLREPFGTWVITENCLTYMITTNQGNVPMVTMFIRPNTFDIYDLEGNALGSFDDRKEADQFASDFCTVIEPDEDLEIEKEAGV